MTEWTPDPGRRGAIGLELHGWLGASAGRDLFHRYAVLGCVTVYVTSTPLYRLVRILRATREALRSARAR